MKLNRNTKILIVGLGVIGGGYATALKAAGFEISCITKEQRDIDYAKKNGMIDYGTTEVEDELIKKSELIIFALYPTVFIEWIKKYKHLFTKGSIITDVSGVKGAVVDKVQAMLPDGVEFISAHPMAGREQSGVEFSSAEVFRGANFIITPTEKNTEGAIELCRELAEVLGFAKISVLTADEHDRMIAFLSQLTHCIAITLMNANHEAGLEKYTGDSFRDLTRIAKINDRMWSELFMLNRDALLTEMDSFEAEFKRFRTMLAAGDVDGMRDAMRSATERRSLFDKPKN